jgi:hypothetical protein
MPKTFATQVVQLTPGIVLTFCSQVGGGGGGTGTAVGGGGGGVGGATGGGTGGGKQQSRGFAPARTVHLQVPFCCIQTPLPQQLFGQGTILRTQSQPTR